MLAGIVLATSSSAATQHLSDPRVVGVIAALTGSLLLSLGLCATALPGGWRMVASSAALVGAVAMVAGAAGFTLNRWTAVSAAAAVCAVTGIFGIMRLMGPGVRARRFRWTLVLTLGPLLATWAVIAIIVATAPGPSTRGFEAAVIPAVTIYVFGWSLLKGLLQIMAGSDEDDQEEALPAARPGAAVAAVLGGYALIPGVVAIALGLAGVLLRVSRASADARSIVAFSLALGTIPVAVLIGFAWRGAPDLISFGVVIGGFLVAKAALLLAIPAFMAPDAVLIAGGICAAAGLAARLALAPSTRPSSPDPTPPDPPAVDPPAVATTD